MKITAIDMDRITRTLGAESVTIEWLAYERLWLFRRYGRNASFPLAVAAILPEQLEDAVDWPGMVIHALRVKADVIEVEPKPALHYDFNLVEGARFGLIGGQERPGAESS